MFEVIQILDNNYDKKTVNKIFTFVEFIQLFIVELPQCFCRIIRYVPKAAFMQRSTDVHYS